jgi:hypothetical protein
VTRSVRWLVALGKKFSAEKLSIVGDYPKNSDGSPNTRESS